MGTYLLGTVGQGCRLFNQCQHLPPEHCGAVVQAVYAVSELTSRAGERGGTGYCSTFI